MSEHSALEVSVGIDVCKAWLDVHIAPHAEAFRVANTKKGHREIAKRLTAVAPAIVVVEATAKLHRGVHAYLTAAGFAVAVVNPERARFHALSINLIAKTDKVDAKGLALYGAMARLHATPVHSQSFERLKEIVRAREAAMTDRTALLNQLSQAEDRLVKRTLKQRIAGCDQAVEALDAAALEAVKADPALARRHQIICSIKGCGDVTALSLIVNLPELGTLTAKTAAMLAGLAPVTNDSGDRKGRRRIDGGRQRVRTGVYMAAQSAIQHNPDIKRFHDRLIEHGKLAKVAIAAAMRKLILLANTLVREDRLWTPQPPNFTPKTA
jgi:transposase